MSNAERLYLTNRGELEKLDLARILVRAADHDRMVANLQEKVNTYGEEIHRLRYPEAPDNQPSKEEDLSRHERYYSMMVTKIRKVIEDATRYIRTSPLSHDASTIVAQLEAALSMPEYPEPDQTRAESEAELLKTPEQMYADRTGGMDAKLSLFHS